MFPLHQTPEKEMEMLWFGESWGAPVCNPEEGGVEHAPTPVGQICFAPHCKKPIQDGDQGFLIPFQPIDGEARLEPWHRHCFTWALSPFRTDQGES